jgi:hypothetical protein
VSATIGLDDPTVFNRTAVYNLAQPGATAGTLGISAVGTLGNAYGGVHSPDVVGNIRIDQAWGLFQISAAAHEVDASYNTLGASAAPTAFSETSGHPDTKWGGSVMLGLNIKNIPTGPGDDIKIDATYAKGDTKNVISTSGASPSFAMFGSSGRAYQSVGFGATTDGVYLPVAAGGDGNIHLTDAWGVRGGYNHNWDPYWSSSLFGSASWVKYDGTAKTAFCTTYGVIATNKSADYSCNPDFAVFQVGTITRWTPVKNLTFSGDVTWTHVDQKYAGIVATGANFANAKPAATYELKDQDSITLLLRAQRNW